MPWGDCRHHHDPRAASIATCLAGSFVMAVDRPVRSACLCQSPSRHGERERHSAASGVVISQRHERCDGGASIAPRRDWLAGLCIGRWNSQHDSALVARTTYRYRERRMFAPAGDLLALDRVAGRIGSRPSECSLAGPVFEPSQPCGSRIALAPGRWSSRLGEGTLRAEQGHRGCRRPSSCRARKILNPETREPTDSMEQAVDSLRLRP